MRAGAAAMLLLPLAVACVAPREQAAPITPAAVVAAAPPAPAMAAGTFVLRGPVAQGGLVIGTAPAGTISVLLDGVPVPVAPDRRFLIAFGRDHGPAATLTAVRVDDNVVEHLTIAPRAWRIEALPIPRGTAPTPAFLAIRNPELAQIKAARDAAASVQSDGWRQAFVWPVTGRISGLFGAQRVYQGEAGSYHTGLDIAQPTGTPVRAPADGVVLLAATGVPFSLEGHLLIVGHGMGLDSAFLHLSEIDVRPGDRVRQGEVIGKVGMTGRATGPHLHWALTWRGERIDPAGVVPAAGG